jgi:clan AA aspartic protease (TIGR02281 family)
MSDQFNPYHKWLGIPIAEMPADHYRLLGLARFEDDREVIQEAAEQRMTHLENYLSGQHGKQARKLQEQVALAAMCLLSERKKAAYDEQINEKSHAQRRSVSPPSLPGNAPEASSEESSAVADADLADIIGLTTANAVRPVAKPRCPVAVPIKRKKASTTVPVWAIAGGVGAAAVVLVVAIVAMWSPAVNPPRRAVLSINIPENERGNANFLLDGQRKELPKTGKIKYSLPPGQHRVSLACDGGTCEGSRTLKEGETWDCAPDPVVAIVIPADGGRADVVVLIDGVAKSLPPSGEVKYSLPPRTDLYNIVVARGRFKCPFERKSEAGRPVPPCVVKWPQPAFGDWIHDFDQAKATANKAGKKILVFFDCLDDAGQPQSERGRLIAQSSFAEQAGRENILVFIDLSPQQNRDDLERNEELKKRLGVTEVPTMVYPDATVRADGKIADPSITAKIRPPENISQSPPIAKHSGPRRIVVRQDVDKEPHRTIPDVPQRASNMDAEEFLKRCGLVTYGRRWVLPEDKDLIDNLPTLQSRAQDVARQKRLAESAEEKWNLAAKSRQAAAKDLDALKDKLMHGGIMESDWVKAQEGVAQSEAAAKEAEAAAHESQASAKQAVEQLQPKVAKLRQGYDYARAYYAKLAAAAAVKAAIAELNDRAPEKKYLLGPRETFAGSNKKIEEIEELSAMPLKWRQEPAIVDYRDEHGSSYVQVELNGKKTVEMVVDSGAQIVSIPWKTAIDIGLNPASGERVPIVGAGNMAYIAWKVTIPTVRVGGALARNVECVVDPPQHSGTPLLGKSFLKHFRWELDEQKRKLVISQTLDDDADLTRGRH